MTIDLDTAPLAEVAAHVTATHHTFLRTELRRLTSLTAQAAAAPGPHQATLRRSAALLRRFATAMIAHMDHEERETFPLIMAIGRGGPEAAAARRQLDAQVGDLEAAHVGTGAELDELHRLCDMVPAPTDAEPLLAELLEAYARVIADTYAHVRLENEVLLPRALA